MTFPVKASAPQHSALVSFRYGQDIEDYESGAENRYFRGTVSVSAMDCLRAESSVYRNADRGEDYYTFGFSSGSDRSILKIIAGAYTTSFGTGLVLGKKVFMGGDPFSSRLFSPGGRQISLAGDSSPLYPFMGMALQVSPFGGINSFYSSSVTAFISRRTRYISDQDVSAGGTGSSLDTVLSKIYCTGTSRTPVFVMDRGIILSSTLLKKLTLGYCIIQTELADEDGSPLKWYMDSDCSDTGITRARNMGAFLSFRDSFLSAHVEGAASSFMDEKTRNGKAVTWGISMKEKGTSFSFSGKDCDRNFYSPHSSGRTWPERIIELKMSYAFTDFTALGTRFYSERDLTPDRYDTELDRKTVQELHLKTEYGKSVSCLLKLKRLTYNGETGTGQGTFKFTASPAPYISLSLKSVLQEDKGTYSAGASLSVKLLITSGFELSAGFSYIDPDRDLPIYFTPDPVESGTFSGRFYWEKTSVYAARAGCRTGKSSSFFRYEDERSRGRSEKNLSLGFSLLFQS